MNRRIVMFRWKMICAWRDVQTAFAYLVKGVDRNGNPKGPKKMPDDPSRQGYTPHPIYRSYQPWNEK